MYIEDKVKQLENKSHVRGILSKQFFQIQETQKEKKRRQMKRILDEQVQQKKRRKQQQQRQLKNKLRKQQEDIHKYYINLAVRDKYQNPIKQNRNRKQIHSLQPKVLQSSRNRNQNHPQSNKQNTQGTYQEEIPVMGKYQPEEQKNIPQIPVLQLGDESNKRKKTKGNRQSKKIVNEKKEKQRIDTLQSRNNTEGGVLARQMQIQEQNKKLKDELKKSQQAINLMMNILKTNSKYDKYRVQAQRILNRNSEYNGYINIQKQNNNQQSKRFFPTLNFNKKSLLHQYILQGARKARKIDNTKRLTT